MLDYQGNLSRDEVVETIEYTLDLINEDSSLKEIIVRYRADEPVILKSKRPPL